MGYLTDEKVAVLGAAGAIGSNLAQILLATKTTSSVALYDPFQSGLEGAAEEMFHCAFPDATVTASTDIGEVLHEAGFLISSGGAPRKEGMTREDLLKGNCEIAAQLGRDIKKHCPKLKLGIIIFNPADVTGLTTLLYSGLPADRIATLAALDSTRLQRNLAKHFGIAQGSVTGCRTYGGHGEQMAVFKSAIRIEGRPLAELLKQGEITSADWEAIKSATCKGGATIIKLRGRSSFQSPAQCSVDMLASYVGAGRYPWPVGVYVQDKDFHHIMMAADTTLDRGRLTCKIPQGDAEDMAALTASYQHLVKMRDELVSLDILPPVSEWGSLNPNLA